MKLLFLTSMVVVLLSSCTSKTMDTTDKATNDSIKKYLDLAGNYNVAFDKRIQYNDKAYSMIDLKKNDSVTRYYLNYVTCNYSNLFKNKELKLTAEKLMVLSLKGKDSLNIGRANRNLGLYYMAISENEKAIIYFFKSKKIFQALKRTDYVLKVMDHIATTQYFASDFLGSNKTSIEMIALSRKENLTKFQYIALLNIGDNLSSLNNHEEALKYYKKTLNKLKGNSGVYNSMSQNYLFLKQYDSASKYVNFNLKNKNLLLFHPNTYSRAISLNALVKLEKEEYDGLEKEFNLAEYYFNRYNSPNGRNYNQIYLSKYYDKINDNKKAIKSAYKALNLSKEYNNYYDILESLKQLIKVDNTNASKYAQEYIRVSDSLQMAERNFRDRFARIAYETNEITQEKEKAINQKWFISSISGVIILILSLLFVISRQRNKQKELQLLQEQQKANEEIYELMLTQKSKEEEIRKNEKKRIALELHDGVMNKLASTRLNLDVLKYKKDAQTIEKCVPHIAEIYNIEQEIRNITHDLSQEAIVIGNSFSTLMNDFLNTQNSAYPKTQCRLEIEESISWSSISSTIKMNLFRIVQEATHNINKFAKAKNVVISFVLDEQNICLSITDNGKGFDPENNTDGIGLKNIKQRVDNLNGNCVIQSIKNKSTSINIAIPVM
jgi:signal transduction histidine kinase